MYGVGAPERDVRWLKSDWCHVNGREDERQRGTIRTAVAGVALLAVAVTTVTGWVDWVAVGRWARPRAALLGLWAVGGLLLAGTGYRWWRARHQHPGHQGRRSPPLSWWTITVAALVIAGVTWGATTWLLDEAAAATDPAAARVEAIKTGLGIGAGTAGVFALLLAVRRQWHQEVTAADTTYDATERRVTDLYTKAVEQLGSDKAPVRLGGLYALERLAQDHSSQRQTIVNVLCAYLRMPYTLPGDPPGDDAEDDTALAGYRERVQEREVRLAAQRILATHLTDPADAFWTDIDLDLTEATLIDLNLIGCQVRTATFTRARFAGSAEFTRAYFTGHASFGSAQFASDCWFAGVWFAGGSSFKDARFTGGAWFSEAQFDGGASFAKAQFTDYAWFDGARFSEARFTGGASFAEAQFTGSATFAEAQFTGDVPQEVAQFWSPPAYEETGDIDEIEAFGE